MLNASPKRRRHDSRNEIGRSSQRRVCTTGGSDGPGGSAVMPRTLASCCSTTLAAASETVGATSARGGKIDRARRRAAARLAGGGRDRVAFLSGELRQRQIGVGWAALQDAAGARAPTPSLTFAEVDAAFARIGALSGPARRRPAGLRWASCSRAPPSASSASSRALLSGGVRQGALEGVMADAAAKAAGCPRPSCAAR